MGDTVNSGSTDLGSRRLVRNRQYRSVLGIGLAASIILHGTALSMLGLVQVESRTPSDTGHAIAAPPEVASIQLVRVTDTPEPPVHELVEAVVLKPVLPVRAPHAAPETPSGTPDASLGGSPLLATARPDMSLTTQLALSMRPQFATQRPLAGALRPVGPLDSRPDVDDNTIGEDEGESFWRRLGVPIGRGGGQICKPRPLPPTKG